MNSGRPNSSTTVALLDSYQTRERKGAQFLDPNQQVMDMSNQTMSQDQSFLNRPSSQYEIMGMQPVMNVQGMIQYVPVVVTPHLGSSPSLPQMQPGTLMQELYERQQIGAQQRQMNRMSQYALQYPQQPATFQQQLMNPQIPQQSFIPNHPPPPPTAISRPQSVYHDPRRSFYDQKSIYSSTSQQPTARPKLPSTNPSHRMSTASNSGSQPGRYRASTYAGAGLTIPQTPDLGVSPTSQDEEDAGWESLRRRKEEMQARRMSRMQTAA